MANPVSPFQAGATSPAAIVVPSMTRVFIRVESAGTFKVNFKINGTADATHADGFLDSGDDVEIPFTQPGILNLYTVTGDPKIYYGFLENAYPEG